MSFSEDEVNDLAKRVKHPEEKIRKIIALSKLSMSRAYCPYSKFQVGAALLTSDDQIFTGCNVENAAYGLCICAERTAIVKAVSEGKKKFAAIAISSLVKDEYIRPCGSCRQFLIEFGPEIRVFCTKSDLSYIEETSADLLPSFFCPDSLELPRVK